jgi:toxin ParE1/3/4
MTPRYRLTEQAQEDVLAIWEYITHDNAATADRLVDRFSETYEALARSPRIGMNLEDLRPGLRAYPVGSYVVFLRSTPDGLEIYRVLHGARDWRTLLESSDSPNG